MTRKPLNKLAQSIVDLTLSVEYDETDGLICSADEAEEELFKLFLSKGMNTTVARQMALMIVAALQEPEGG